MRSQGMRETVWPRGSRKGRFTSPAGHPGGPASLEGVPPMSQEHTALLPDPPLPHRGPEVRIIGHSPLYYWWPVWVVGFIMALLTYTGGHRMAVVPAGTVAV